MKVCCVFPGQGSQFIGMGEYIYYEHKFVREIFDKSKDILGYEITKLMFNGPEEDLRETINCQLAIFLVNFTYFSVLNKNKEISCSLTLGHSIGEYSALAASGALSLEDAIKLVKKRAELMTECIKLVKRKEELMTECIFTETIKQDKHYMAAVLNDNPNLINLVNEACEEGSSSGGIVGIASINSSSQIIISGNNNAIIKAVEYLKKGGIKKIVYLKVEGPFHSELMRPAAEEMKKVLKNIEIIKPKIQYISNSTGNFMDNPDKIKESLAEQICGTVKWKQSLETAIKKGFKTFIESGSGEKQYKLLNRDYEPNYKGLKILATTDYI